MGHLADILTGIHHIVSGLRRCNAAGKKCADTAIVCASVEHTVRTVTGNTASMTITIGDKETRDRSDKEIAKAINEMTAMMPGVSVTATAVDMSAMMTSSDIAINLKGQDLDALEAFSEQVMAALAQIDGITNVSSSMEDANTEIAVYVNKDKAAFYRSWNPA